MSAGVCWISFWVSGSASFELRVSIESNEDISIYRHTYTLQLTDILSDMLTDILTEPLTRHL